MLAFMGARKSEIGEVEVKTKQLVKVTDSNVHCKCSNISETVQDKDVVVTTDH